MKTVYRLLVCVLLVLITSNAFSQITIVNAVAVDGDGDGYYGTVEIEFSIDIDDSDIIQNADSKDDWEFSLDALFGTVVTVYDLNTAVTHLTNVNVVNDRYVSLIFTSQLASCNGPIYFRYSNVAPAADVRDASHTGAILSDFASFSAPDNAPPAIQSVSFIPTDLTTVIVGEKIKVNILTKNNEIGLLGDSLGINDIVVHKDSLISNGDGSYYFNYWVNEGGNDIDDSTDPLPIAIKLIDAYGNANAAYKTSTESGSPGIDANTPVISSITFSPTNGNTAGVGDDIVVTINTSGSETTFIRDSISFNSTEITNLSSIGGGQYTFTYNVTEGDNDILDSEVIPFSIEIKDIAGNISIPYTQASVGAADCPGIDAHTPAISGVIFNPVSGMVGVGENITVIINTVGSDTNLEFQSITFNTKTISNITNLGTGSYLFTYTVGEDDGNNPDTEVIPFSILLRDVGLNITDAYTNADILPSDCPGIDSDSPEFTGAIFDPAIGILSIGDSVIVTFNAKNLENNLTFNSFSFNGKSISSGSLINKTDGTYSYKYIVIEGDNDILDAEKIPFSIVFDDINGNTSVPYTEASILAGNCPGIDANKPAVTGISFSPGDGTTAKIGSTITVTINTLNNETTLSADSLMLNNVGISNASLIHLGGGVYSFPYVVASSNTDISDASAIPVRIELTDLAGNISGIYNTSTASGCPGIDAHAPIISSASFSPNSGLLKIGDTLSVTINAGETELTADSLKINGKVISNSGLVDNNDNTYTFNYIIAKNDNDINIDSKIPIRFLLKDPAGNKSVVYTEATLSADDFPGIDAHIPVISSVSFSPLSGLLGINQEIRVTITASGSDAGLTAESLMINGKSIAVVSDSTGGKYGFVYTIASGDNDISDASAIPINFVLKDAAGNLSAAYTTSASGSCPGIDANKPAVTGISFSPGDGTTAKIGSTITVTINTLNNETTLSADSLMLNNVGISNASLTHLGGGVYSFTYVVASLNTDISDASAIPVRIELKDLAGNISDIYNTSTSYGCPGIDAHAPVIDLVSSDAASDTQILKVGETITFTVDPTGSEADAIITPTNYNGGVLNWTTANSGDTYTAVYTVIEGQDDQTSGLGLGDVVLTDVNGNPSATYSYNLITRRIDANTPSINNFEIPNSPMKLGDKVICTITVISDTGNYILNSGSVAAFPIDSIKKNTDSQYFAYFSVTSTGYDIEAGQTLLVQNLILSDFAGNMNTAYSKAISQANDPIYTILPTGKVSGSYHKCEGDTVELKMDFTGRAPWSIVLDNGSATSIVNGINQTPYFHKIKTVNSTGVDADTIIYKINQVTDFTENTKINTGIDSAVVYVGLVPNAVIIYPAGDRIYNISTPSDTLYGNYSSGIFTGTGVISSRNKFYPPEAGVGSYKIFYNYTTPFGCSDSDSIVFTVINSLGVIYFPDHSPKDDYLYCDYESTFTVTGDNINSKIGTFSIEGYSGSALINNFDNTATIDPKQLTEGTYTLIYTYDDEGIVNIPEQFTIESVSPLINFTDVGNHCSDYDTIRIEAANLFPIGGTGNYTFSDPTSGALVYNPIDSKNNKAFLLPDSILPGIYNLSYYYTSPSGCSSDTIIKNFEIFDLPTVSFTMNSVYNIDQGATLISGDPLGSTGVFTPLSFMLNNGNGTANFDPQVAGLGDHTVMYSYTDGNGCKNSASKPISVTKAQGFLKGLDYYISGTDTMYQYCYYGHGIDTVVGYSFNGDGTPGSFFINGQPVPSIGIDSIEFNPQNYGSGNHIIRYAYNNGPTSYYFEKTVNIDSIGDVDFVGFVDNYCEYNNSQVQLTAVNPIGNIGTGVFSGNGVVGSKFTPSLAQLGENTLSYMFTRTYSGCKRDVNHTITVNKTPTVDFYVDDRCFIDPTDSITFYSDTLASDSVIMWRWVFDNSITSNLPNLKKSYSIPGFKDITLEVETNKGCVNNVSKYLKFDLKPEVFFSWGNECFGGETKFDDQTENEDPLNIYTWDFNDGTLSTLRNPMHMFSDTGQYFVKLAIETSTGCISEKTQPVNIRPSIRLFEVDYFQDFESGQGGWISELISNSVSWEYGTPAKEIINSASSGTHAWVTKLTGNYLNNEQSMITSPCFNFEDIKRPMIKIDYLSHTEKDRDGAVIQFSDTLGGWKTIGIPGEGVNWYNSYVINGSPANQQLGWTGPISDEWQTGKFILDELVGRSTVRFRIVFGSDAAAADEGFAFDNVWIGERQRVVLLEHFTNPDDATSNTVQNNTITPIVADNPLDILNINYQMSYPTANSLNAFYPAGPSARSLFYGVSRVPYSVIDGSHRQFNYLAGNNFTETDLHRRVLEDPKFKIEIEQELQGTNYAVSAKLIALDDLTDIRINAQIALVERTVNYNGNKYYNVLRALLPDPAGTLLERNWLTDDSTFVQHSWPVQSGVNTDSLIVIVFVQDADSKEVYQSAFSGELATITAIDDLLMESENDITVYPNPASKEINIRTNFDHNSDIQLYLYNNIGLLVKTEVVKQNDNYLNISTSDLQSGIYYLKFIGEKGFNRSIKVIIAK
ncbi:MAG: PKD domain-containing protein [Bacteroidales bacterium]